MSGKQSSGQHERLEIVNCVCTCWACPSQFECETPDGQAVYLRYRHNHGTVGVGKDLDEAVGQWPHTFEFDATDWNVTLAEFAAYMPDWIVIDASQSQELEDAHWGRLQALADAIPEGGS